MRIKIQNTIIYKPRMPTFETNCIMYLYRHFFLTLSIILLCILKYFLNEKFKCNYFVSHKIVGTRNKSLGLIV